MVNEGAFWKEKRVFITGHTGFKGGWLSLRLQALGAKVAGYSLEPPTTPSLFVAGRVGDGMKSRIGDVKDLETLRDAFAAHQPEIVFHLAAQPLVRYSYEHPVETYATNLMGTVHLLEAVRLTAGVRAVVVVTSDKCYENREWVWGYRETDPMGGFDPYSSSKGCSELIAAAYRNSFFPSCSHERHGTAVATARAGNVIGGGDWALDRLIPDIMRSFFAKRPVKIRNPHSIRPWQHVLEPVSGYMLLARRLYEEGEKFAEGWNFGPSDADAKPVDWIVDHLTRCWGQGAQWELESSPQPHEARYLKLDCSKSRQFLGWNPRWDLARALDAVVDWHKAHERGEDMHSLTLRQIEEYQQSQSI